MRVGLAVYVVLKGHGRYGSTFWRSTAQNLLPLAPSDSFYTVTELYAIMPALSLLTKEHALGSMLRSPDAAQVLTNERLASERRDDALLFRKPRP